MNYVLKTIKKVGGVKDKFIRVFETNKIKFKRTHNPILVNNEFGGGRKSRRLKMKNNLKTT